MSEMPETLRNLGYHLRVMADKASEQIDADRLSRAADEVERADLPPTLSAAMQLPEIKALVEALELAANRLHRCAVDYDTGTLRFYETCEWTDEACAALAAIKEPKT